MNFFFLLLQILLGGTKKDLKIISTFQYVLTNILYCQAVYKHLVPYETAYDNTTKTLQFKQYWTARSAQHSWVGKKSAASPVLLCLLVIIQCDYVHLQTRSELLVEQFLLTVGSMWTYKSENISIWISQSYTDGYQGLKKGIHIDIYSKWLSKNSAGRTNNIKKQNQR